MISVDGLTVEFGDRALFKDISFQINEKDRIALMGKNCAGKSTLLKILAGQRKPSRGNVSAPKDTVIAYLPQHLMTEDGRSVYEEASQAFAPLFAMEKRIDDLNRQLTERTDYDSPEYYKLIEEVSALSEKYYSIDLTHFEADVEKTLLGLVLSLGDAEITAANTASLSGKLSQMANGAIYDDSGETIRIHDRKLDALEDIIEAANGKPLLVAYWFKHDLTRISERLRKLHIPFSKLDDAASIRRWNNGELPVALIHPASAGHGLNLQSGGSAIVWFGLTWSLELYQQTIARLWRQGQTSETVVVQHIVTKGTIDERIMKALSKKEHTQTALIDAVKADLKI